MAQAAVTTLHQAKPATLPELWTKGEAAKALSRSCSGLDKLRARDTRFPKPLKSGTSRHSRTYFVRGEVEAYLMALLAERGEVA